MVSFDSDSSSDAGNEYTTTNVVLGYVSTESGGDDISHVGGYPFWLDPSMTPPPTMAKCKVCNGYLALLLQLNADLQQHFPNDQRRLQVWSCKNKTCSRRSGSIRAFREVRKGITTGKASNSKQTTTTAQREQPMVDMGAALFGGNPSLGNSNSANPFSTKTSLTAVQLNPFSSNGEITTGSNDKQSDTSAKSRKTLSETFANTLTIVVPTPTDKPLPKESWPENDMFPAPYPFYYLDAYPEELDPVSESKPGPTSESSKTKYDIDDASSSGLEKDSFESSLDKTFQKFSDLVAQNPEQVLRYEFQGHPLLYSGVDSVASRFVLPPGKAGAVKGIPQCEKCKSPRVFEMQLTPNLIYEIEKDEAMDIENGMDWGAIIVGTCRNNCGEEGSITFSEEWVGVQWEERIVRR